jgi:hypothetical protein
MTALAGSSYKNIILKNRELKIRHKKAGVENPGK